MTRILKRFICLALGVTAACSASGFSLWGPLESWQTQDLDYGIRYLPSSPMPEVTLLGIEGIGILGPGIGIVGNVELGGTKNIGEGSRLNVPIITYAYDTTFLTYFGAQGVAAVDSAFAVLNGLPKASSAKLTQFITQGNQQINYSAQAMRMLDLKSTVLWLMMEHMGLIGETHTFDLRERVATPAATGSCDFLYVVLQRNFDPISYDPSDYVNGTLLTYQIGDLCPAIQVGDAMEVTKQVGTPQFSAVATREALEVGGYYLRISRDDMGGLRYLYSHDRYVNEGFDVNTSISALAGGTWSSISLTAANGTGAGGAFSALLGGVEKILFVKTPYDSVLGTAFDPITYRYTIPWVTNGVQQSLRVTRTVTAPDIIFTAGDITFAGPYPYQETLARSSGFITYGAAVSPGAVSGAAQVTPSVITPEEVITFNNSGLVYYNEENPQGTAFLSQASPMQLGFIWGSFNGSTNAPIPFPNGTSLDEIEAEVLSAGPETEIGIYTSVSLTAATNTITATAAVP
jgi:hypothetical protein